MCVEIKNGEYKLISSIVYTSIAAQAYNYNLTIENDFSFLRVSEDIAEGI